MLHARMLAGKTEDMHAGHGASPLHP
jgi:hypothetical protein